MCGRVWRRRRSAANHAPISAAVRPMRTIHVAPNDVCSTAAAGASSAAIWTASMTMFDASTATRPMPISVIVLECTAAAASSAPPPACLRATPAHTRRDEMTAPRTTVWPARPGNRAPACSKKISSPMPCSCPAAGSSTTAPPTPKTNADGTRWPSTLDRTLLATVYTPSPSGAVVTIRAASPSP